MNNTDEILGVDEVKQILKVNTRGAIYKAIHAEGLPMRKKIGKWVIRRSKLQEWIDN